MESKPMVSGDRSAERRVTQKGSRPIRYRDLASDETPVWAWAWVGRKDKEKHRDKENIFKDSESLSK